VARGAGGANFVDLQIVLSPCIRPSASVDFEARLFDIVCLVVCLFVCLFGCLFVVCLFLLLVCAVVVGLFSDLRQPAAIIARARAGALC
jgi:hypothetical protein